MSSAHPVSLMGKLVFVDSSFWIALRDVREAGHLSAQAVLARLFRERTRFVLTPSVFGEIHAYFVRSAHLRKRVLADFWNNPVARIETESFQDLGAAIEWLREHPQWDCSLCDVLCLVVMRRLGIRRVATFDHHFRQFGEFEIIC